MNNTVNKPSMVSAKLITCLLADNGTDKLLMQALRSEKQIIKASSISCRGIAALQEAKSKYNQLPSPSLVKMVEVVVAEDRADELFDYIYEMAGINKKGHGTIFMRALLDTTLYKLPDDIPDEMPK